MKRFLMLMIVGSIAFASYASDGEVTEILMSQLGGDKRQATISPFVEYSQADEELIVVFDTTESCTLQVKDASGVTLYTSSIITNGNEYSYPVQLSQNSIYYIYIYSASNTFWGTLFIP